eukprot:gb/GECG01012597.1/.p1 GENE.gb/GECG01012597.1/~~gb/GECG01012597.1/.p1  ORF type:complete len:159 (+),score=2.80 gb/GECG01012597.1/:1-477(+)
MENSSFRNCNRSPYVNRLSTSAFHLCRKIESLQATTTFSGVSHSSSGSCLKTNTSVIRIPVKVRSVLKVDSTNSSAYLETGVTPFCVVLLDYWGKRAIERHVLPLTFLPILGKEKVEFSLKISHWVLSPLTTLNAQVALILLPPQASVPEDCLPGRVW